MSTHASILVLQEMIPFIKEGIVQWEALCQLWCMHGDMGWERTAQSRNGVNKGIVTDSAW